MKAEATSEMENNLFIVDINIHAIMKRRRKARDGEKFLNFPLIIKRLKKINSQLFHQINDFLKQIAF